MCVCVCVCVIPGGGHGHPLQYFCLGNPMGRAAWRATVHRVAKSQMWLKRLSSMHIYNIYPLYFRFPYHLGHHRAMSRVPCVKQELRLKKFHHILRSPFLFVFVRTVILLSLSCLLWSLPGLCPLRSCFLINYISRSFKILDSKHLLKHSKIKTLVWRTALQNS